MTQFKRSRTATHLIRSAILAVCVASASVLVAFAAPAIDVLRGAVEPAVIVFGFERPSDQGGKQRTRPGPPLELGVADGLLPDGVTVFDDQYPGVANLDPDLLAALGMAATDASRDGITFQVTSGWRSPEYQDQLLRDAVVEYGSEDEAAKWVATAETSAHVSGDAVDIGPAGAMDWLAHHGAGYGLCQIYRNEPWHFELRPDAIRDGCPAMYDDPTQDPRMRP